MKFMLIKVRRDTLIILLLAFLLIVCGRVITYVAYASTIQEEQGVPITGVQIKGNDVIPLETIKDNVASSGLREGSYIDGSMLHTTKRTLPLTEAVSDAKTYAMASTIPGTTARPITAVDIKIDNTTGIVTVTVVEDFSRVNLGNSTTTNSNSTNSYYRTTSSG